MVNPATDAQQNSYAFFGQDDWKVSQRLTINFGLRWEYHPGFHDINNNMTNWVPDYVSTVDGMTVHGASILPNQAAFANVNPQFTASIYPTPIILASKVGLGESLRSASKKDFAPRIGFAYRIGSDTQTIQSRGKHGGIIYTLRGDAKRQHQRNRAHHDRASVGELHRHGTHSFTLCHLTVSRRR